MSIQHRSLNFPSGAGPAIELIPAPPTGPGDNPEAGLRVYGIFLTADKKSNVFFHSSTTNKPLMGNTDARITLDEAINFVLPPSFTHWIEVPKGEALHITVDSDVALAGALIYDDSKRVDT